MFRASPEPHMGRAAGLSVEEQIRRVFNGVTFMKGTTRGCPERCSCTNG